MGKKPPSRVCASNRILAGNCQSADPGTALAIYADTLSCSLASVAALALAPAPSKGSWGGPRNRADRLSDRLTLAQCEKLIAAALFAERIGLAFNRHWTVHTERAGIQSHDGRAFVGRLLHLVTEAVRRHGGRLAAIWVRENGDRKGEHVHILMHLPAGMKLTNKTRRWIVAAGGNYRRNVSYVRSIGGPLVRLDPLSELYRVNARNVLAYVLKYASRAAAEPLGLPLCGERGWIVGKRSGCTQNIAQGAQRGEREGGGGRRNVIGDKRGHRCPSAAS
jgi:hypothetical protein